MSQFDISKLPQGPKGFVHDLGSDQRIFKGVPWGKAMMWICLLYTSPSPRDGLLSRMPSSA